MTTGLRPASADDLTDLHRIWWATQPDDDEHEQNPAGELGDTLMASPGSRVPDVTRISINGDILEVRL